MDQSIRAPSPALALLILVGCWLLLFPILAATSTYDRFFNISALNDGTVYSPEKYWRNFPPTLRDIEIAGTLIVLALWRGLAAASSDGPGRTATAVIMLGLGFAVLMGHGALQEFARGIGLPGLMYTESTAVGVVLCGIGMTLFAVRPLTWINVVRWWVIAFFCVVITLWAKRFLQGDLAVQSTPTFVIWAVIVAAMAVGAILLAMAGTQASTAQSASAPPKLVTNNPPKPALPPVGSASSGALPDAVARAVQAVRDEKR